MRVSLGGANRKQTNGVVSPVKLRSRHAQKSIPMIGAVLRASFFLLSGLMLGFAFLLVASQGSFSLAQVTPAITPTTGTGNLRTAVTQAGNTYHITGGTRPSNGPNLFHSFGEFGVPTNTIANFLNETALPTSNIFGRVTGGNPSNVFGTIQTTGFGGANLFLMNPAGIVFGPSASLNVGGSATFTTADYLRFADGAHFNAMPGPQDAAISSAPLAAFGFLGSNPAAITVSVTCPQLLGHRLSSVTPMES